MSVLVVVAALVGLLLLSASYSGSETGVYSISRLQLDAEAREGRRAARLLLQLMRRERALLITLLVGNNLMLELLTSELGVRMPAALPAAYREIVVALVLTPIVFLFGELLPKDLFRRRPHLFLSLTAPLVSVSRLVFAPLVWPLSALSAGLERLFGLGRTEVARALGREEMLEILQEGTRTGALARRAEELALNVLVLRETPIATVMVPWPNVRTVDLALPDEEVRAAVAASEFSRLPAVRSEPSEDGAAGAGDVIGAAGAVGAVGAGGGGRVVGYVHQLDVLAGDEDVAASLREIPAFAPDLAIDRALARLRLSGQRLALVGEPDAPIGLVTLMDLAAAISGRAGRRPGRR